jgi:hypothetical protein
MSLVSNLKQRLMTSLDDFFPADFDADGDLDKRAFDAALRSWFRSCVDSFFADLGVRADPAGLEALLDELVEIVGVAFDYTTFDDLDDDNPDTER